MKKKNTSQMLTLLFTLAVVVPAVDCTGGVTMGADEQPLDTQELTADNPYQLDPITGDVGLWEPQRAVRLSDAPASPVPPKKKFRKWTNRYIISKWRPIGHMVHDAVVTDGMTAEVVGKFDYGTTHKDLEGEYIHAYIWKKGTSYWSGLGRTKTNGDGKVYYNINRPVGEYVIKMVVEGDLSDAYGYLTVLQPGQETVLFDIDGTITAEDLGPLSLINYDEVRNADIHADADRLIGLYESAGFQIFYLTARPYWLARPTRDFIESYGLPENSLSTTLDNGTALAPTGYKRDKLLYLTGTLGLDVVRVYGNADTDIEAYEQAGFPKSETYIIGENAGDGGTQPINPDYSAHADWVQNELGL